LKAKADTSAEALKKLVETFATFKVTKTQIEKRIQRRLDTITPAQLIQLRKIYNSLKDGMSSPADWFDPEGGEDTGATGTDGLKEKIKGKKESGDDKKNVGLFACPDTNEMISKDKCEGCEKREGCPAWE
jgi:hypothetical protein